MKNDKSNTITNNNCIKNTNNDNNNSIINIDSGNVDNEKPKRKKSYNYITERDRYLIEYMYTQKKMNIYQIAKELNREYSTVYREIKKGSVKQKDTYLRENTVYKADYAQMTTEENLGRRGREMKCRRNSEFIKFMEHALITERYSPRAGLCLYYKQYGDYPVCLNTVYNYIYNGKLTRIKRKHLPYKPKEKKTEIKRKVSLNNVLCKSIEDRDKSVLDRHDFGHWEMDTVVGRRFSSSCLLVLTERKTRFEIVRKIKDKSMCSVVNELDKIENDLGRKNFRHVFKTITCDNGVDFLQIYRLFFISLDGVKLRHASFSQPFFGEVLLFFLF